MKYRAWQLGICPLSVCEFKQVSVTLADNRMPQRSEGTSSSCQPASFDVALGWLRWPLLLRVRMKRLWKERINRRALIAV